ADLTCSIHPGETLSDRPMMPLEKITNLDYRFDLNYKSTRSTFLLNPELTLNLEDDRPSSSDDYSKIARRCQMIQESWR
uniref:hypothetical protein n=1 Tax=Microcoleus sp. OTE_8_concoct_300 TaxID=2964710 RepID=UPI00403FA217